MWRRPANVAWWLALSVYFGGMVALGAIAAPAIFQTVRRTGATLPGMPAWVNASDQLGGEVFGNILARFQTLECVCLAIMALALALMRRRDFWMWLRLGVVIVLAALLLNDIFMATPSILRVREAMRTTGSAEARATFDRLHASAVDIAKLKVGLLLGLVAISAWLKAAPQSSSKGLDNKHGEKHA